VNKEGILDPAAAWSPRIAERSDDEPSVMCEMADRGRHAKPWKAPVWQASDLDAVLCAASNMQRAYPAMAVEIQAALGAGGYAFDMNVACSSATFGLQQARDTRSAAGSARHVLDRKPGNLHRDT
jgi:beta-ketodecanoyl-[acyl-carrier-protein] synthase